MWEKLASFIIRYRIWILFIILGVTGFMAFQATKADLAYDMQKLVPKTDADYKVYEKFIEEFGEDGNKLIVGFQSKQLFTVGVFNDLYDLSHSIKKLNGINDVLSLATLYELKKNDSLRKFELFPVVKDKPSTIEEVKEIKGKIKSLKFYEGLVYNSENNVTILIISLNKSQLNTSERVPLVAGVKELCEKFGEKHKIEMHYSGLPYVRTEFATKVKDELKNFTLLAFLVTSIFLFLFFRSLTNIIVPILVVILSVIWSLGFIGMLGYKITLLLGLVPPLMVVIGIPNCIYLINKYHDEYRKHGNKVKGLSRIVSRIGVATILTNFTTAIGFGVFYFTKTTILQQFGVITFLSIVSIFIISITIIPIAMSFLKPPTQKQTRHLDNKILIGTVDWLHNMVFNHKRRIYFFSVVLVGVATMGLLKLHPLVYIVDDVPKDDKLYTDLIFLQTHFKGVMPLEIIIDTGEPNGLKDPNNLQKIYKLQKKLKKYEELSRPLSIIEMVSFANQAWHDGEKKYYRLPNNLDLGNIVGYIPESGSDSTSSLLKSMIDPEYRKARLSIQMADVGSERMQELTDEISTTVNEIFPLEDFDVQLTGTSIVFLKGNKYLVKSLVQSLILAFILIAIIMGALFTSYKMVIVSLLPNVIPLVITSGIMGFFDIPLKPSTILIFSIAFGIAVDDTIHFLAKFRHELRKNKASTRLALSTSIKETGMSMIYTSVVLFFGFIIFAFSNFEGTVFLGLLTSLTLLAALFSNLFVLPSLILSFEKGLNPKEEMEDAVIDIDEEDD